MYFFQYDLFNTESIDGDMQDLFFYKFYMLGQILLLR